jgi:aminoglycoside 3-N-acetyltransferase
MAAHPQDCHLGPRSPLGALCRADAKVLLLGVSFAVCSVFHLAEYSVPGIVQRDYECVVRSEQGHTWYRYRDVTLDDSDFELLGSAFESSVHAPSIRRGIVGEAESRLFPAPCAAAFAADWLANNRDL